MNPEPGQNKSSEGSQLSTDSSQSFEPNIVTPEGPEASQPDAPAQLSPTPAKEPESWQQPATAHSSSWKFSEDSTVKAPQSPPDSSQTVSWSASEYVAHHKGQGWFLGLGLSIAALAIVIFFVSHDLVSPIMVAVLGIAFGVFAARQPRTLEYTVNHNGLAIGQKFYSYDRFKSFSVVEEGPVHSILFEPLQRFMPPLSVYFEPTDEDKIVDVLGDYLPFIEAKRDTVDSLMRRVRF